MRIDKKRLVLVSSIIGLGLVVQAWAASRWPANFDSDEAPFGLMAMHCLQGKCPTYVDGQYYIGSFEALLSSGFLYLFGHGVLPLRMANILLFGCFLLLSYLLLDRLWGHRGSLIGTLLFAIPSWSILRWTYRPVSAFGILLVAGTGVLLLSQVQVPSKALHYVRLVIIGILIGLGLWSRLAMMAVYLSALGYAYCLQSPEWRVIYRRLELFFDKSVGIPLKAIAPVFVVVLAGIVILALFSGGCAPQDSFATARRWALAVMMGLSVVSAIAFWRASQRRRWLLRSYLLLGIGTVIGSFPLWKAWIFFNIPPASGMLPSCPTDSLTRASLLVAELIPMMWGATESGLKVFDQRFLIAILSILAMVIMLCALLAFLWNHRTTLWSLMSLSCTSQEALGSQVLFLLFCVPMISTLFIGVDINRWSTRYLLVSWQAGSVILAWFLDWLCQKKLTLLSALVLLVWATQTLAVGYAYLHQAWRTKYHEPAAITKLEDFFRENNLCGGYADYWLAYTLDFLTEERLTIAPYNGIDRFLQYTELVESLPVQAYLLPAGAVSQENSTIDDLIGFLKLDVLAGDASPGILDPLAHQSVLKRQTIVWWDVWIVSHR